MADKEIKDGEKGGVKEKLGSAIDKIKNDEQIHKGVNWLWEHRFMLFVGALMLLGIIFSFYYIHIGGFLVGLALGLAFFKKIQSAVVEVRALYLGGGLFKVLMLIGGILYLLIALPVFVIGIVLGFVGRYVMHWIEQKK